MTETDQARCRHCQEWFVYEVRRISLRLRSGQTWTHRSTRCVCDACKVPRRRWARQQARLMTEFPTLPGEFTSRTEIAEKMGLTVEKVEEIERAALAKLRSSPELRAAYEMFKADGMPLVHLIRKHIRAAVKAREEDLMLQLQMEIMDWWRVYDLAVAQEMPEDARLIRRAIGRRRRLLVKELGLQRS